VVSPERLETFEKIQQLVNNGACFDAKEGDAIVGRNKYRQSGKTKKVGGAMG